MTPTCQPTELTRAEAQAVLSDTGVRAAYMVDAVLSGVKELDRQMSALTAQASHISAVFSLVDPHRVQFALFVAGQPSDLCAYEYNPDAENMAAPKLYCTDSRGRDIGTSAATRQLQPLIDFALARMESSVWERVKSA
ncbi:hypothetical protein [Burkholderia cenocepacia]|uniref:hypothetical protein n=1 Tax=Burkholderia cenocepacia TaxID=95486 RepID=UPI000761F77B|nr:hypothetical protein [Burkholderia cenocepacia]KWU24741.1 hypothetical protein AS149_31855 [Burkholderia cenocepacia]